MLANDLIQHYQKIFPMILVLNELGEICYESSVMQKFFASACLGKNIFEILHFVEPETGCQNLEVEFSKLTGRLLLLCSSDKKLGLRAELIEAGHGAEICFFLLCTPWLAWMHRQGVEDILSSEQFPLQDSQLDGQAYILTQKLMRQEYEQFAVKLEAEKKKAESASFAKSKFVSHISHELRTPLNGIVSSLRLIVGEENEKIKENLFRIAQSSSLVLLEIVNEVLDYSKIEQGMFLNDFTTFNISDLFSEIDRTMYSRAKEQGVFLQFQIDSKVPDLVFTDRKSISKVLHNLVGNAISYSRSDVIIVSVYLNRTINNESILCFRVEDFGVGVPEKYQEKLFLPFWSGDHGAEAIHGTGLGLPIAKELIESLGGSISLESVENEGTALEFSIPVSIASCGTESTSLGEMKPFSSEFQGKILLVDDNYVNVEVTKIILEKMGLDVDCVFSGEESVSASSISDYDLIFMDINMPGLDGLQAAGLIKEQVNTNRTPIVALTANASLDDKEKYINAGVDDVLLKPISPNELCRILEEFLVVKRNIDF